MIKFSLISLRQFEAWLSELSELARREMYH